MSSFWKGVVAAVAITTVSAAVLNFTKSSSMDTYKARDSVRL